MFDQFSLQAFIFIFILIIYVLTAHFIDIRKVPYLHESGVAILMGFLAALFVSYALGGQIQFNNQIFFTIILPPIIFSAGYSLRKSLFFQNFGMISFLGVIGTIIGFVLLSIFLSLVDNVIFKTLTLKQVLMLSSVLCATDTVAAMSLIKPQKYPVLNAVLFGEGIINDAVAIILFRTVQGLQLDQSGGFTFEIVLRMAFDFLILFFFSLAIGAVSGFGLSYLLKVNESFNRSPIKQTSLILLTGYATYLLGELCGLSGIITLFTCAIIMGHYTFMNISQESQRGTGLAFQTVSYVAEAFVYAYLGACVVSISSKWSAVGFSFLIMLAFPLIRASMVYLLPCIYKMSKKQFPLNGKQLKVCWYSGMVRGVIAFALCLQIQSNNIQFIQTVTVVIVMVTTLLGASLLKSFMKFIGMDDLNDQISPQNVSTMNDTLLQQSDYRRIDFDSDTGYDQKKKQEQSPNSLKKRIQLLQQNYVSPIFIKQKVQPFNYDLTSPSQQKNFKQPAL